MRAPQLCLGLLALLGLTSVAHAQYYYGAPPDSYPVHGYVMGGYSQPVGNTNQILQGGYTVGGGVAFRPAGSPFALRLELSYADNNATHVLLNEGSQQTGLQITGGWADIWAVTANGEFRVPFGPGIYGYVLGGAGAYYTRISLTSYGSGYVCDPWWGFCYFASGNLVVDRYEVTKFGWNAGAGVSFALRNGMNLFVEARYNQIEMPQKFEYVPITVGLRF